MATVTNGDLQQLEVLVKDLEAKEASEESADVARSQAASELAAASSKDAAAASDLGAAQLATKDSLKALRDFVDSL